MFDSKHHIGYGILPSALILTVFYIFYFSSFFNEYSVFVFCVLFTFLILMLKKGISVENILSYIGFKWLPIYYRSLYLMSYYFLFLLIIGWIEPAFFTKVNRNFLLFSPFVFLYFFDFLMKKIRIEVLFVRITNDIYIDLISFNLHRFDSIKEYDISFQLDDDISSNKLVHFYQFFNPKNVTEQKKTSLSYTYEFSKVDKKVYLTINNKMFGVILDHGDFHSGNIDELVFYIEFFEEKIKKAK